MSGRPKSSLQGLPPIISLGQVEIEIMYGFGGGETADRHHPYFLKDPIDWNQGVVCGQDGGWHVRAR